MKKTLNKVSTKSFQWAKAGRQHLRRSPSSQSLLFILGCQRSGTTMMQSLFERDWDAKVYGEFSELSNQDSSGIRLNALTDVQDVIAGDKAPLVIVRPLVESQRTHDLLDFFGSSRALWLFRNHRDVVSSNVVKFGKLNGVKDLTPIVEQQEGNWRSERVSERSRRLIEKYFFPEMSPYDAAALFWYARNDLFFDQHLQEEDRVLLCKYEDVVTEPSRAMNRIYSFAEREFPGDHLIEEVHATSIGKGEGVDLTPEIDALCEELYRQVDASYQDS